jgi:plastocyanin
MRKGSVFAAMIPLMLLIVLLAGCGSKSEQPASPSGDQAASGGETSTVILKNVSFQPNTITVKAGTEVTFENQDSMNHTVTGPDFDSGSFGSGKSYQHVFGTPGVYEIRCTIHPGMKMTVTVQ